MIEAGTWLAIALLVPLGMLLTCISRPARTRMLPWLLLAPIPALAASLFAAEKGSLALGSARFHLTFALDLPGAILLSAAALLWIGSGAYASRYMRDRPDNDRFVVCWLMALTGCIGVFIAADMVGFYFLLALLTLGAFGLVIQDNMLQAWRAGTVYLGLGLLAEAFLLVAFVMLANITPNHSLLIRDAAAALSTTPQRDLILALLIVGFGIKAGLVPLHFWMPLAYSAAPIPASAVLSGAIVKASVLGLLRFLPLGTALPDWGTTLVVIGMFGTFYGVVIGLTQSNPKVVLAYSSVSQMGFIVAVIGMGQSTGEHGIAPLVAFYAAHHVLVKGSLFLAIGVVSVTGQLPNFRLILFLTAVIAIGLGGLPFTGGSLAKLAVKGPLGDGLVGTLAAFSACATTILMLHFLHRLAETGSRSSASRMTSGLTWPWLAMALISIAMPWVQYLTVPIGSVAKIVAPAELWSMLWPVLLGGALAIYLKRQRHRLPHVPEGDIAIAIDSVAVTAVNVARTSERIDRFLRQWPVANILLLALTALLAAMLGAFELFE